MGLFYQEDKAHGRDILSMFWQHVSLMNYECIIYFNGDSVRFIWLGTKKHGCLKNDYANEKYVSCGLRVSSCCSLQIWPSHFKPHYICAAIFILMNRSKKHQIAWYIPIVKQENSHLLRNIALIYCCRRCFGYNMNRQVLCTPQNGNTLKKQHKFR